MPFPLIKKVSAKSIFWTLSILVTAANASLPAFAKAIDYDGKLTAQLAIMYKNSHYGSSGFDHQDTVDAACDRLNALLLKWSGSASFMQAPLKRAQAKGLAIAKSTDNKLRVYSWDTLTGGSAHIFQTVFQYQTAAGKFVGMSKPAGGQDDLGACYTTVKSVGTANGGVVYVLVGDLIGSNIDQGHNIVAYTIKGKLAEARVFEERGKLSSSIDLWVEGAEAEQMEVKFADQNKTIKIPMADKDRHLTGKYKIYKFNGSKFVLTGNRK